MWPASSLAAVSIPAAKSHPAGRMLRSVPELFSARERGLSLSISRHHPAPSPTATVNPHASRNCPKERAAGVERSAGELSPATKSPFPRYRSFTRRCCRSWKRGTGARGTFSSGPAGGVETRTVIHPNQRRKNALRPLNHPQEALSAPYHGGRRVRLTRFGKRSIVRGAIPPEKCPTNDERDDC